MPLPASSPAGAVPHGPASFLVHVDLVEGHVLLAGHLGRSTAHQFLGAVSALLLTDRPLWVVDAAGITTCDHMGVRVIGVAYRRAVRHHRRMTLRGGPPSLRRDLARLRLDQHLRTGIAAPDARSA